MNFRDYLDNSKREIEKKISEVLASWKEEIEAKNSGLLPVIDVFLNGMSGGKRLRGILVKMGYCLIKPDYPNDIITSAAAYEIFQTAILIHDDVIDKSELRRMKKSAYVSLGSGHYGISQAICLGDIGFFLALRLITATDFQQDLKERAVKSFIDSAHDTALGQILDVKHAHFGKSISRKDILDIYHYKTAQYSIIGPLKLGAILAGVDDKTLEKIVSFGHNLGIAFQIQDDILGVFSSQETLGKPVSADIKSGKKTLLLIEAKRKADKKQQLFLDKYYGNGSPTQKQIKKLKKIFIETGALAYTEKTLEEYFKKAENEVWELGKIKQTRQLFSDLVEYLVSRKK